MNARASKATKLIARLEEATNSFDSPAVDKICREAVVAVTKDKAAFSPTDAKTFLTKLRRKRYFANMEWVAKAMIDSGRDEHVVRKLRAQALVDQGKFAKAKEALEVLIARTEKDPEERKTPKEHPEALGLLGRVYKQQYVNAAEKGQKPVVDMKRALKEYYAVFKDHSDKPFSYWHGANAAALLCRAKRDKLKLSGYPAPEAIAQTIIAGVERMGDRARHWDLASAGEACLVFGDFDGAERWFSRYLRQTDADAFELASTYRQLVEVWQLKSDKRPGEWILDVLRGKLLRSSGGAFTLTGADLERRKQELREDRGRMEAILGEQSYEDARWIDLALERIRFIGRVETRTGKGIGTGFLVKGSDLAPRLGDELYLVTNAHVITNDPKVKKEGKNVLFPHEARVVFQRSAEATRQWSLSEVVWTCKPSELDVTIAKLTDKIPDAVGVPISADEPTTTSPAYIAGYPQGGSLKITFNDNLIVDFLDPRIHYRAATEGGHSGSPVFDAQWDLMGVHHMGSVRKPLKGSSRTYVANEGIWINSVRTALQEERGS